MWRQPQGRNTHVPPSRGTLSRAGITGTQCRFSGETWPTRGASFRVQVTYVAEFSSLGSVLHKGSG